MSDAPFEPRRLQIGKPNRKAITNWKDSRDRAALLAAMATVVE
jgi:hypothetical protein